MSLSITYLKQNYQISRVFMYMYIPYLCVHKSCAFICIYAYNVSIYEIMKTACRSPCCHNEFMTTYPLGCNFR